MPKETITPMPKETITPSGNYRTDDGEGRYVPQAAIEVSWMRDLAHVGIGVVTPAEQDGQYHLIDVLYGGAATRAQIGKHVHAALADASSDLSKAFAHYEKVNDSDGIEQAFQQMGRAILDAVTGSESGYSGYYTGLTERRDLNHLIRQLKRARDGAFGRDE